MSSSIKFSWVVYDFVSTFDEKKNFPKSSKGTVSWDPNKVNRCHQIILQIIIVYGLLEAHLWITVPLSSTTHTWKCSESILSHSLWWEPRGKHFIRGRCWEKHSGYEMIHLFTSHLMKVHCGLDTAVHKLMETRENSSISLDTHQLVGNTTCKWMNADCMGVVQRGDWKQWHVGSHLKGAGVLFCRQSRQGHSRPIKLTKYKTV